jgi:hypothetical protein
VSPRAQLPNRRTTTYERIPVVSAEFRSQEGLLRPPVRWATAGDILAQRSPVPDGAVQQELLP